MEAIRQEKIVIPGEGVRQISEKCRAVLLSLLEKDFRSRVTINELVSN